MKQNFLLKSFVLLIALLAGGISASWGQTTLFYWQNTATSNLSFKTVDDVVDLSATTGTLSARTTDTNKSWSVESATYATSVEADMKDNASGKGLKAGGNANYLVISLSSGTFQEGDIIYISGYNPWLVSTSTSHGGDVSGADGVTTGSSKSDYQVGSVRIPEGINTNTLYLRRQTGSGTGIAAIKIVRLGAQDPTFSLTKSTIGTDETSQIQVGETGNLDGITLTGLTSSDPTVATVDATGLITPLKAGTTTISFTASSAVENKYNATSTTVNLELTVTAPVVDTPVITPADGSYFFGESQTVTATSTTDGATLSYSIDNGATWTELPSAGFSISATTTVIVKGEKNGYTASQASATITKFTKSELVSISDATTWDWSSWSQELQLTDDSTPTKNDVFTYSDIALINNLTLPSGFDGTTLTFKGAYPVRNKVAQDCVLTFNTTVPGTVQVFFKGTGSSPKERFVYVNGTKGSVQENGGTETNETFTVEAGDVEIQGTGSNALRFIKIVFTPKSDEPDEPVAGGVADFKFTAKSDWTDNKQTVEPITAEFSSKAESSYVPFKKDATLTLTAADGYMISAIELGFVSNYAPKENTFTASVGNIAADGLSWTGFTPEVVITNAATGSNDARINVLKVTYVSVVSGTITESGWNTFSSNSALDLSMVSGGSVYFASTVAEGKVVLEAATGKVPAATGMFVKGTAGEKYYIATTTDEATAPTANLFVGLPEGGNVEIASEGYNYVFGWQDVTKPGFYKVTSDIPVLAEGKAYLHTTDLLNVVTNEAPFLSISIGDEEATGIKVINAGEKVAPRKVLKDGRIVIETSEGTFLMNGTRVK